MAINATPSDENADSYLTLADAETYFTSRLFKTNWDTATDVTKEAALKWATKLIDAEFIWKGTPAYYGQSLGWPRGNVTYDRRLLSHLLIPVPIKNAVCELALALLAEDRTKNSEPDTQGLSSLSVGPVNLSFDGEDRADIIPESVRMICQRLAKNSKGVVPVVRS